MSIKYHVANNAASGAAECAVEFPFCGTVLAALMNLPAVQLALM